MAKQGFHLSAAPCTRRRVAALLAAWPALALPATARAEWLRDEIVVYAEPPLRRLLAAWGRRYSHDNGAPLRGFCAAPDQMLGLLAHGTQDDVLIVQSAFMRSAEQSGLVEAGARPLCSNTLVFATAGQRAGVVDFNAAALAATLAGGKLAVPDATVASALDGYAVLARAGLGDGATGVLAGRVQGAADTTDALGMLRRGEVAAALAHISEVAGDAAVRAAMNVPASAYDPITYEVALSKSAWSRHQDRFVADLAGAYGPALGQFGLRAAA